jgi:asparagine synthetase B (glutamine-hydrolysing)
LTITGDPAGERELFAHLSSGRLVLANTVVDLLHALEADGVKVRVSAQGISHFLQSALCPAPLSIFEDVYCLAAGDRLRASAAGDRFSYDWELDYPFLQARSRQDSRMDPQRCRDLITQAVVRHASASSNRLLMLSSGKDSMGLFLGLKEAGLCDTACVTFANEGQGDPEAEYAAAMCKEHGFSHQQVFPDALPPKRVREVFDKYFQEAVLPSLDFTQPPYLISLAQSGFRDGVILDGTGNDGYSGYIPGSRDRIKDRFSLAGMPRLAGALKHLFPPDSAANYLLQSRAENSIFGSKLRHVDMRGFFPASVDTSAYWLDFSRKHASLSAMDFRSMMLRQYDQRRIMQKARQAAPAFDSVAAYPYADNALADYVFNLPQSDRLVVSPPENKVWLRRTLAQYLGYDAAAIGKRRFEFNGWEFLLANRAYVQEQITECSYWDREAVSRLTRRWFSILGPKRWRLANQIQSLFLLSGWLNQSRWHRNG